MTTLHRTQRTMLVSLADGGGSGRLDQAGRVCVGPTRRPIAGDANSWLILVTHGLVAGEDGMILMTQAGRDLVAGSVDGTVRQA